MDPKIGSAQGATWASRGEGGSVAKRTRAGWGRPEDETVLRRLLRAIREEASLTQYQVADRLGVPQSVVSKYESGVRRLDVIELRAVCQACGTNVSAFVRRLEKALETEGG